MSRLPNWVFNYWGLEVSQGLMVYLVPAKDAIATIGCKDEDLLANILEEMAGDIQSLEEQFDTDDEEYGPGLTFSQALHELFQGSLSQPESCGFVYTYAFEEICRYYGEWLGNRWFVPCNTAWLERLDELLSQGKVRLRFHDLISRCPVESPLYRDVLALGHWKRSEAMRARRPLDRLLSNVKDESERLALENAREWLVATSAEPGSIVVGVFC